MKNNKISNLLSVFRIKSLSVYKLTLFLLVSAAIISISVVAVSWAFTETRRVQKEISKLKESAIILQEKRLKEEALRQIHYLNYIQKDTIHHSVDQLKEEALIYFESIRFGNNGYVFVNTFDGMALLFDGKKINTPKDISEMTDPGGLKLFNKEMELANIAEGGSFQYQFKKINDSIPYPKMSYIMGFDDWGWIIGAGDYLDSITAETNLLEATLKSKLYDAFIVAISIFIPILILLILLSTIVARSVQKQFDNFVNTIKRTELTEETNPFEFIFIRELKEIAIDIANAEERSKQLGYIIEQSQSEIYIFNEDDLHFVLVNSGARKNCGYSKTELLKMTALDIKPQLTEARFSELLEPLKQNKIEQVHFETVHQRKDKSLYPVDVHLAKSVFNNKAVYVAFIYDISIRKEAEIQLKLSNQRFSDLFNNAPISIWEEDFTELFVYLDLQLEKYQLPVEELFEKHPKILMECSKLAKVTDMNNYSLRLYEAKSKEEILGSLDKLFTKNSMQAFGKGLAAHYKGENYFSIEGKNKTLAGREIELFISWSYVINKESDQQKVIVSVVDITDLRKAEHDLHESEARFRSVFENDHTVMFLINPETGKFIDANNAAVKFYGYSHLEFINNLNASSLNTLNNEAILERMEEAKSKKQAYFNFNHRLSSGEIREVEIYSGPLHYQNKTVLFSIVHDVSEKRKSERALLEAKNKMESIFRAAPTGIGVLTNRVFTEINERFCEMIGYTAEDLLGKESELIYSTAEEFERVEKVKNEQIAEKGTGTVETKFKRKNGKLIDVLMSSTPIDLSDLTKGLTITALDISKRVEDLREIEKHRYHLEEIVKDRTQELEQSQMALLNLVDDLNQQSEKLATANKRLAEINEELETFTYSVSHDLKAPLRGIDGYSQLLIENFQEELNPEASQFLENIRKSSAQMNLLIEDLLAYSRMERKGFQSAELHFSQLMDGLLNHFSPVIKKNKFQIIQSYPKDFSPFADQDGLALIMRNLFDNAIKFSSQVPNPQIEIGASETHEKWIIFVKDNGIGFDMKYSERIFKIFQRLHLAEEFEGTGIGLAMVAKAAQRMNGKVWAESEEGKGATFFLEIRKV